MRSRLAICLLYALTGGESAQAGDAASGEQHWKRCKACHDIGPEAKNKVGPVLNDLLGRTAGTVEGFKYSQGMIEAGKGGLVWSVESLDTFIANPKDMIDKTRMSFRGINEPGDRADLIAYLATFSSGEAPAAAGNAPEVELDPEILAIEGDAEYGEYLSSECLACHQASGNDNGIPAITGWQVNDFVTAMHAYKQKIRPHPVMQMMAGRLSNEEIAGLAAYFRSLE